MERDCTAIQEDLVEVGGRLDGLTPPDRDHVAACSSCSEIALQESRLGQVLERAVPPADETLQREVLTDLRFARLKRRLFAAVPVAASLMLALSGFALLGSLPGGTLFARVPQWSSAGWMSLAATVRDWQIALGAAATSASGAISPVVLTLACVLGVAGVAAAVTLARTRQRNVSWQRHER